jgi:hypothetical protein
MLGSRVGSGSQKSRSSQNESSTGTTPTQKTRDIAVITVNAGEIGRKWGRWEKAGENEIDGIRRNLDRKREKDDSEGFLGGLEGGRDIWKQGGRGRSSKGWPQEFSMKKALYWPSPNPMKER